MTVYPRWRGEHHTALGVAVRKSGLSPLARGTPKMPAALRDPKRFIPAGAGNTNNLLFAYFTHAVYPRWRGEHTLLSGREQPLGGLSPLARGTPSYRENTTSRSRFIPAGAGNTPLSVLLCRCCSVYPRWRGEHYEAGHEDEVIRGLSPLARGTRNCSSTHAKTMRFIPAGAGNTLPSTKWR